MNVREELNIALEIIKKVKQSDEWIEEFGFQSCTDSNLGFIEDDLWDLCKEIHVIDSY